MPFFFISKTPWLTVIDLLFYAQADSLVDIEWRE